MHQNKLCTIHDTLYINPHYALCTKKTMHYNTPLHHTPNSLYTSLCSSAPNSPTLRKTNKKICILISNPILHKHVKQPIICISSLWNKFVGKGVSNDGHDDFGNDDLWRNWHLLLWMWHLVIITMMMIITIVIIIMVLPIIMMIMFLYAQSCRGKQKFFNSLSVEEVSS